MSIDLNWETLTGGPDGEALAEQIRDFIHTKFQSVPLPRFIKSVTVHNFEFGSIPPQFVLKDICDPLPDFYEEDYEEDDDDDDEEEDDASSSSHLGTGEEEMIMPHPDRAAEQRNRRRGDDREGQRLDSSTSGNNRNSQTPNHVSMATSYFLPAHVHGAGLFRSSAPGTPADLVMSSPFLTPGAVPGGTSNMHYFQSRLAAASGWSGTQTPLAAVAGAQHLHLNGWLDSSANSLPSRYQHPGAARNQHSYSGCGEQQQVSRGRGGAHRRYPSQSSISVGDYANAAATSSASLTPAHPLREKHSVSTLAPTSAGPSRPPTRGDSMAALAGPAAIHEEYRQGHENSHHDRFGVGAAGGRSSATAAGRDEHEHEHTTATREPRVDDLQAVFRIRYAGDVRLMLTAEILLDYPMPSFVGIPVKLSITGLTFDGVGVVAHIRKRVHFCFLSPEDAVAAVGGGGGQGQDAEEEDEEGDEEEEEVGGRGGGGGKEEYGAGTRKSEQSTAGAGAGGSGSGSARLGGLLQEIRVESEIGQREGSKQSLKNVGKVEKFVLEQVRRIFEEEFVYPSFWTFLV